MTLAVDLRAGRQACLALLVAAGCTHSRQLPPEAGRELLPFLEDGRTTAEQLLLELGIPTAQFEDGRILTFRLLVTGDRRVVPVSRHLELSWRDPRLASWPTSPLVNLIVVLDERLVVVRHAIVQVR